MLEIWLITKRILNLDCWRTCAFYVRLPFIKSYFTLKEGSHVYYSSGQITPGSPGALLIPKKIDPHLPCFVSSAFFTFSPQSWIFRGEIFMAANEYSAQSLPCKLGKRGELNGYEVLPKAMTERRSNQLCFWKANLMSSLPHFVCAPSRMMCGGIFTYPIKNSRLGYSKNNKYVAII